MRHRWMGRFLLLVLKRLVVLLQVPFEQRFTSTKRARHPGIAHQGAAVKVDMWRRLKLQRVFRGFITLGLVFLSGRRLAYAKQDASMVVRLFMDHRLSIWTNDKDASTTSE